MRRPAKTQSLVIPTLEDAEVQTPNFAASRLTLARQRRGMTKKALSDVVGVSAAAVTQFEGGTHRPSAQTAMRLSFALSFPHGFFFEDDLEGIDQERLTFRARRNMSQKLRDSATAAASLAMQVAYPGFDRQVNLPTVDVPDLSRHNPKAAAQLLRARWGLGSDPVPHLIKLLEGRGVQCYWIDELARSVDAYCYWLDDRPFMFFNLRADDPEGDGSRARFDAAHELGHLVLHRYAKVGQQVAKVEEQADLFAAEFLMPEAQFGREAPRLPIMSQFLPLKRKWGVSVAAMIRRSHDLKLLSDWHYHLAYKEINERKWRRQEMCPIDREDSVLFPKIFSLLAEQKVTPSAFASQLRLSNKDLLSLIPTAQQFHSEQRRPKSATTQNSHLRIVS